MSILSNRPRPESNRFFSGENSNSRTAEGWETDVGNIKDQNVEYKLIKLANSKISLYSIINKYNIQLEKVNSSAGWSHKGTCPFPSHNDRRPSFGYNSNDDRFNCFGCHRSGRAVEFISAIKNKPALEIAKELLNNSNIDVSNISFEEFDYRKLEETIFEYADFIRSFKESNNFSEKSIKYAEAITWNLDVYLRLHAPTSTISLENLEARILKLKNQILAFEEK